MIKENIHGVPRFECNEYQSKQADYVLLIPVINEGDRIINELQRGKDASIQSYVDIVICDGDSSDGSLKEDVLRELGVNTLLIKKDIGKQGSQLRMGFYFAKERKYKGIITIDGNNKDSIEDVSLFVSKLEEGFDLIQGSRFVEGGEAINTPLSRLWAIKLLHAPITSIAGKYKFTDTTNAYRGYSMKYLSDDRVDIFRDIFDSYELLAYLEIRAGQLGYKICEIPVKRFYPINEKTPTKISPIKGNINLFKILLKAAKGDYNPD